MCEKQKKAGIKRGIIYESSRHLKRALITAAACSMVMMPASAVYAEEGSGKRIAIIGKNRYEWLVSYFAVLGGLGICVPLDKGLPYEELESSLSRSGANILIFDPGHKEQVEKLKTEGKVAVKTYIAMEALEGYPTVYDYMQKGAEALEARSANAGGEEIAGKGRYTDLCIDSEKVDLLLFTSGTTSVAKAVMLSQRNIMSNLEAIEKVIHITPEDTSMAFLPYHHTFGAIGQFAMISMGATTTYCDGLKYLQSNLVEYKVSVFFCVPLLIESIYKRVMATVKKEGKEKTVERSLERCWKSWAVTLDWL